MYHNGDLSHILQNKANDQFPRDVLGNGSIRVLDSRPTWIRHFVRDFALHYPLHVIMILPGVPEEDGPFMLKLTQDFVGTHDPEEQREGLELDPVAAATQRPCRSARTKRGSPASSSAAA